MNHRPERFRVRSIRTIIDTVVCTILTGLLVASLVLLLCKALCLPVILGRVLLLFGGLSAFSLLRSSRCWRKTVTFTADGVTINGRQVVPWKKVKAVWRREKPMLFPIGRQEQLRLCIKGHNRGRYGPMPPPVIIAASEDMGRIVEAFNAFSPVRAPDRAEPAALGARLTRVRELATVAAIVALAVTSMHFCIYWQYTYGPPAPPSMIKTPSHPPWLSGRQ